MLAKFLCNQRQYLHAKDLFERSSVNTTRHVYQMKIRVKVKPTYAPELQRTVNSVPEFNRITSFLALERLVGKWFQAQPQPQLPQGAFQQTRLAQKQYFVYLLIDPRVTDNLAERSPEMDKFDVWRSFLASIFYVGKGKAARPHAHLREAARLFGPTHTDIGSGQAQVLKTNRKLQRIWQIWRRNCGVVCVQAFHHIGSHEAHTREAAIIDAMSLSHLVNRKRGQYYGIVKNAFSGVQQRLFGVGLLYKAMHMYLAEGESEIGPQDVISSR